MFPSQRTCDVETIQDFSRYYNSSWVGHRGLSSEIIYPCFVRHVVHGNQVELFQLNKGENDHFSVGNSLSVPWEDLKANIDFGMPDIGMVQDGPTLAFLSYSTPRVAKKGYRSRDVKQTEFNKWEIRKKYAGGRGGDQYEWVWFAFNPGYKTLEQAEEKLSKGELVGIPISRTLGVYSMPKFKHSLLAYKRWTVGHVVNPYLIHLKEEYSDYEEDIARQTGAEVITV